jgi:hypothetical protein
MTLDATRLPETTQPLGYGRNVDAAAKEILENPSRTLLFI